MNKPVDGLDDETVVVPRVPAAEVSAVLDDETVVVPRRTPPVEPVPGDIDDQTVVVARPFPVVVPDEVDDHTVVVARPAPAPVLDDNTVVVVRPAPASAVPEPDDATVVVPRGAPAPAPAHPIASEHQGQDQEDDDATALVARPVAPPARPTPAPAGPGTIENARQAVVPGAASGDSNGLLKERYQIRSEVTTVPVAAERTPFVVAPNRHAVTPIGEITDKTNRVGRSRGIGVIVAIVGVTVLVAAAIGVILLVVLTL